MGVDEFVLGALEQQKIKLIEKIDFAMFDDICELEDYLHDYIFSDHDIVDKVCSQLGISIDDSLFLSEDCRDRQREIINSILDMYEGGV